MTTDKVRAAFEHARQLRVDARRRSELRDEIESLTNTLQALGKLHAAGMRCEVLCELEGRFRLTLASRRADLAAAEVGHRRTADR